ncbi:MAG TPA: ABC transporter ATP-binding protein [Candidatus Saccharimonadales bacterium]|nr:ABC transporter ATP-binding protein [Candidatus Saccharimonadales bacterium]
MKLVIDNVSKSYESGAQQSVPALDPVNIEINEGEFVVFVGPSGCGKTTLLNLIAGFARPSGGQILLDGKEVERPGRDRLMMFQEPALFPWLNVIDNVSYGVPRNWLRLAARKEKARAFLRMVHLEKVEKSLIHELSGGMKQRVALARALAPDPRVLLIDEPFSGLDAMVKLELYLELQRIHQETRKTIIFVTHEMQEAACLGDRILIFSGSPGRVTHEVRIDLPRPRDFNDPKVMGFATELMDKLKQNNQTPAP